MRTLSYTLGAGDTVEVSAGNFFQYLRGSDPIEITFWRGSARLDDESTDLARPGYKAAPERLSPRGNAHGEAVGFTSATIKSPTAQTIEIGVSMGEGGYNRYTGDTEITSPLHPDGSLDVGNREDKLQRAPLTTLENAAPFSANNSTTTITTAGNNTDGVIIRTVNLSSFNNNGVAILQVDGSPVFLAEGLNSSTNGQGGATVVAQKNLYVPPGVSVEIKTNDSQATAHAWAEVL